MTRTTRSRTTAAALGLALAAGLTGASTTPSAALGVPPSYQATDGAGDVKITRKDGLSDRQRRSIDLGSVQIVQDDANREIDVAVQLRRVTGSTRFDQVVTVAYGSDTVGGAVRFSPSPGERRSGAAGRFGEGGDDKFCRGLVTRVSDGGVVSTSVPYRCVPDVPVSVDTLAATEPDRGGRFWSHDLLRSEGTYQLRPAAG